MRYMPPTLQAKTKVGASLPWIQMITNDLNVLYDALPNKLENLPRPLASLGPYWNLVRSHPMEWKTIVRLYDCPYDDVKAKPTNEDSVGAYGFECEVCSRSF